MQRRKSRTSRRNPTYLDLDARRRRVKLWSDTRAVEWAITLGGLALVGYGAVKLIDYATREG